MKKIVKFIILMTLILVIFIVFINIMLSTPWNILFFRIFISFLVWSGIMGLCYIGFYFLPEINEGFASHKDNERGDQHTIEIDETDTQEFVEDFLENERIHMVNDIKKVQPENIDEFISDSFSDLNILSDSENTQNLEEYPDKFFENITLHNNKIAEHANISEIIKDENESALVDKLDQAAYIEMFSNNENRFKNTDESIKAEYSVVKNDKFPYNTEDVAHAIRTVLVKEVGE